ncbi:hypothetical protein ACIP4Y_13920 [Streptomyces sp. NPDC088810]|uniref:hypothetical protein n=1 Tax=Streptomyces sp. NPDC088810 TaxID=3365904 RepID=UPI00380761FA
MELLTSLAGPCVPQAPATVPPEPSGQGKPRTAPTQPPTLPGRPAPETSGTPAGPREELAPTGVEKREARVHARRIGDTPEKTPDPAPGQFTLGLRSWTAGSAWTAPSRAPGPPSRLRRRVAGQVP